MESVRVGMKYCPLTEVTSNTPAGFKRGKTMLGMRILLSVSICFMTSLSFHGCRWLLHILHDRGGNLVEVVLVSHGISLALSGLLRQSKVDTSMKSSLLKHPTFVHFLPSHTVDCYCKISNSLWKRCNNVFSIVRIHVLWWQFMWIYPGNFIWKSTSYFL